MIVINFVELEFISKQNYMYKFNSFFLSNKLKLVYELID